jgi:acetyl esterase/lipase
LRGIVPLGEYNVGFCDTVIFNTEVNYSAYGYQGKAPLFLEIWHPISDNQSKKNTLSYGDFRRSLVPSELQKVYATLNEAIDSTCIVYNISETFDSYDPIDYSGKTYRDVLAAEKMIDSQSTRSKLNGKSHFPVIIYHHGSQGLTDENFAMAEYFASRGYVFISANYHLPYKGLIYGLNEGFVDPYSFLRAVATYSKQISSDSTLFFIGHSWGAQIGLVSQTQTPFADAIVSMETTMEMKTDTAEIKDKWADIYKTFRRKKQKLSLPTLMFGNNGADEKFPFFSDISDNTMIHVSTRDVFGHESYTSAYWLRYLLKESFPQPDADIMQKQMELYLKHLDMINSFFTSIRENKKPELNSFNSDFFIHLVHP